MSWHEFLDLDQQLRLKGLQEQGLALVWTDGQTEVEPSQPGPRWLQGWYLDELVTSLGPYAGPIPRVQLYAVVELLMMQSAQHCEAAAGP